MKLGTKFTLLVVAILVTTLGLSSFYFIHLQRELSRGQLTDIGRAQGKFLSMIAPDAMVGYDFVLLNQYVERITEHEDILFSAIFDANGTPVTTVIDRNSPIIQAIGPGEGMAAVRKVLEALIGYRFVIVERFPIELEGKRLGELVVAVDTRRIEGEINLIAARQGFVYLIITILLSAAIYLIFARKVMRPVKSLIRGAERVAEGEYAFPVKTYADDELGRLTETFNAMMAEIKREQEKLDFQANYDALTGLPNRSMAMERLYFEINRSIRDDGQFAVLFIDLDNFKHVNDTLGHAVGDQLLIRVGERFRDELRNVDLLARLGGDEYLVLLPNCKSASTAQSVAQRLLRSLGKPIHIDGQDICTQCSIGIAFFPTDGKSAEAVLAAADSAMYSAKNDTASRMHFYTPEMNAEARRRTEFERDIHGALQREEFFLVYQPIVQIDDYSHRGAEVLLRWRHAKRGLIPTADFIPLAESTGQIHEIGEWVLEQACRDLQALRSAQLQPGFLSLNLSRQQIRRGFDQHVMEALRSNHLDAHDLVLEVTEGTLMEESGEMRAIMEYWRDARIRLALDDFGTGFTSLGRLGVLGIDTVKIDRRFVEGLPESAECRAVVRAIIALADSLELEVIAKGVENDAQRAALAELGCRLFQGYLFQKPISVAEYERYLSERAHSAASPSRAAPTH